MIDDSRYGRLSRAEGFTRQARDLLDGTGLWNTQHGRDAMMALTEAVVTVSRARAAQLAADHRREALRDAS